ncbi:putative lipid II flippase FtsW [Lysobacter korlensis]|uniref:Probable peptidoglycan glycosyltransferase FtsW n=1 Tax=Lysobacter korlensis TaxID=553636 RepID=A0ABV6RYP0_9GAMM
MTTTTRPVRRPAANRPAAGRPAPDRSAQAAGGTPVLEDVSAPVAVVRVRRLFSPDTSNYVLLLSTTVFLVIFGLVMVLSSSAIEDFRDAGADRGLGNFFSSFSRQGLFAAIGIPIMLIASRMPAAFWKKWAWAALALGVLLQLFVVVAGVGDYNRNWIAIGPVTVQPSEFVKLGLALWLAMILVKRRESLTSWKPLLVQVGPVAAVAIGLVLVGNDLGTTIVLLAIVLGALFFAGVKLRYLTVAVMIMAALGAMASMVSSSRMERILLWVHGCSADDYSSLCWQPQHGLFALAAGGFFGVGLGNSKAKWSWLPAAHNDFIFAIIGEELGMLGALVVLLLFVVLAVAFVRIIRSARDPFARIAASAVMVWVVGQAFVNIGVVLGLLPVLGVPLPLISAGGSALISTLLAIGIVLSFARTKEPV